MAATAWVANAPINTTNVAVNNIFLISKSPFQFVAVATDLLASPKLPGYTPGRCGLLNHSLSLLRTTN